MEKLVRPANVSEEVWNGLSPSHQRLVMEHEKMHEVYLRASQFPGRLGKKSPKPKKTKAVAKPRKVAVPVVRYSIGDRGFSSGNYYQNGYYDGEFVSESSGRDFLY
jgi:hypothetical protein